MCRSFIFCQAPAKIPATLVCYEMEKRAGREVVIVTKNVELMKDFFELLHLDATVEHLDSIALKGSFLLHSRLVKKTINKDIQRLRLDEKSDNRIFFTDICDDWIMGVYLSLLSRLPIVKIDASLDIQKEIGKRFDRKGLPLTFRIRELLYSAIYGYPYLYSRIDHWTLTIDIRKLRYPVIDCSDMEVCKRYLISPPGNNSGHNVLFFTEPYRNKFQTEEDYINLNKSVIEELRKKGYRVGVKGHPRIGLLADIESMVDFVIPQYIPAEFINLKSYDFAIGFVSTSVCNATQQIAAYSVLPMCHIIDKKLNDYWYDYIDRVGNGKVVYLEGFDQIPSVK